MRLPGRLELTTLGDLLGKLYRARATGTLELTETHGPRAGATHRIDIRGGLVREVDTAATFPAMGEVLKDYGFINELDLASALAGLRFYPGRLGQYLVERGKVSEQAVRAALRRQLRARVDALFSIDRARIAFRVPRAAAVDDTVPLAPQEFLHGRPRGARQGRSDAPEPRTVSTNAPETRRASALRTLGLPRDAEEGDVRRAFRQLARQYHPDRDPSGGATNSARLKRFVEVSAAYHRLVG